MKNKLTKTFLTGKKPIFYVNYPMEFAEKIRRKQVFRRVVIQRDLAYANAVIQTLHKMQKS